MLSSFFLLPFHLKIFRNPYTMSAMTLFKFNTGFMLWQETILIPLPEETFCIYWHVMDFVLFSYVWLRLRTIANNSLRVLWGSQYIGEATPGLIKSKKAKQKVLKFNFLWFFSHKYLTCKSCFSSHSCPSFPNCPWHFSPGVVAKWLPK